MLMSQSSSNPPITSSSKSGKPDNWGEDEAAEKAREKRLRDRLRKWEKGDAALHHEFSQLSTSHEGESGSGGRPEIIVVGGPGGGLPPGLPLPSMLGKLLGSASASGPSGSQSSSSFFRSSVLVPSVRSQADERVNRVARRREINELTMRMGVGAVGGTLESVPAAAVHGRSEETADQTPESHGKDTTSRSDHERMWHSWGNKLEVWSSVREIADRAVGNIMAVPNDAPGITEKPTLDPTVVSWPAVHKAWAAHRSSRDVRKQWMKEASPLGSSSREEEHDEEEDAAVQGDIDEVVERVKNDSELDSHEQRLLSCIVDAGEFYLSHSME